jgi:spore coat-associated protein S
LEVKQGHENSHLNKVLEFYPFKIENITLLSSRSGRTTWEVETDQGVKILKQAHMNPRRMLFIAGAHMHLLQNGLRIVHLHQTKNNGLCIGAGDYAYVLYDKVEGDEMIYYNKEQMAKTLEFAGEFHRASKGFIPPPGSKKRSRLGKYHKLYRWKLQELEGNMKIALSYPNDPFSIMFLQYADKMLERGRQALASLDDSHYLDWTKETIENGGFCQQDFTLARFNEVEGQPFMRELHSITDELPIRDLRIILNKVMKKMSIWDRELAVHLLASYDSINPLTENNYRILWIDLTFPYLFCSIIHKYYLGQKRSWSDEKYIWALQNIIAVEESKEEFLRDFSGVFQEIKQKAEERR